MTGTSQEVPRLLGGSRRVRRSARPAGGRAPAPILMVLTVVVVVFLAVLAIAWLIAEQLG
jgi:uncharacterized RDD family membrane protein YckC